MKILASLGVVLFFSATLHAEPLAAPVLERYEQMLLGAPESGTAFDKIYQHYLESEGLEALAARWREAAGEGGPARPDFLLLLGMLDERRGNTEGALRELREAAETGGNWRAWSALAAAEARAGQLPAAIDAYKKTISLNPPRDAVSKIYRGLALCQQRQMDAQGAAETWQAYAKAAPDDPFALEEAGDALLEAGRHEDARAMFAQLGEIKDVDPLRKLQASLRLAEVERQRGNKDEALRIYNAALEESGETSWLQREVRAGIERLFRSDDDLPGLAAYYEGRLKAVSGDLEASLRLSETLAELNRNSEALKVLEAAADKARDRKDVQLKLADALLRTERPADAESVLDKLAAAFPGDTAVASQLGEAKWQSFKLGKGNQEAAVASWRKLAPEGADAGAIQSLAEVFRAHGLVDEAIAEYRRALALDPAAGDRRERLAEYLVEIDRKPEAMTELTGLVADGRASGENSLRLAKLQRRFGDNSAARKSLKEAEQFPDRAFERRYLAWQIASEEKGWEEAEDHAVRLRELEQSKAERERADDCLVDCLRELKKTDAEIRRLLNMQKASPEAFTEGDWRLLFVLALEANDSGTAEFALVEGLKSFPKSSGLSELESDQARRTGDLARRLASLERLEQIEPQRKADWMAERVRALREAERWDEAIALARKCVALSPARTDSHLLLADTLLAARKQDEAMAALKEAIRLAGNANQIRLRLADAFLSRGEFGPARDVIEEAFEAEETFAGKLQLTNRLASVYLQDGKLDELIAKLRDRQKAEQGGWRYALYLAEVYMMMQDSARAMEELDKALAGKPDDPTLLKKLYSLAESNGDTNAALRYAEKLARIEPSKQHRAQLGSALAKEGKLDEALALIKENAAEFLGDPLAWQDAVRQLESEGKAGDLADLFRGHLRANPNDWQSLLTLAGILMGSGQSDKVAPLLWQVVEMKEDPAAVQPASSPGAALTGSGAVMVTGTIPPAQMRQMRFGEKYQQAMQILSKDRGNARVFRRSFTWRGVEPVVQAPTLADAQDEAIVYLACLAVRDGRESEFLDKLSVALCDRTPADRLTIYGLLQTPELLIREAEGFVASGAQDPQAANSAFQALQGILANRQNNRMNVPVPEERLKALMSSLADGVASKAANQDALKRYQLLSMLGKKEEAEKLTDEILADQDSTDVSLLLTARQLALSRRDLDAALRFHERLESARRKGAAPYQRGRDAGFALALLENDSHRSRGITMLAEEVLAPGSVGSAFGFGPFNRQQFNLQQMRGNLAQFLPYPTRELDQQRIAMLRGLVLSNPQARKSLSEIIRYFEKENSATLKQAAVWLRWFSGQNKEAEAAMKTLVERQPSDELLINYSLMLAEARKPQEALKVLENLRAGGGDPYEIACRLRLAIALQSKDRAASKEAALKLASLRLIDYEQRELVQEMKRLGLKEQAAKLEAKPARVQNPGQRSRQMVEVMRERMQSGSRDEAITLAYAILGRDPLSRTVRSEQYQQEQALRALDKFGELGTYISNLQQQLQAAPQSPRINVQLAQAFQIKDPKQAEPYFRKLVQLRPQDPEWLQRLGNLLVQSEQNEEAIRLYEKLLTTNPAALLSQGTNFLEPFRRVGSWQRLADAVAKSPDPVPDPLNPNGQNYSDVFVEIGRSLQRARPPVSPIDIWLKGLRWEQGGSHQLRPILAQALIREGRNVEARQVIEEAFFPPLEDESSARLFVFNRQFRPNMLWSQVTMYGNGEIESPGIRLMRTAAAMGFLQELMPRIAKIPSSSDGSDPGTLARVVARDESVLADIRARLVKVKEARQGSPAPGIFNVNMCRLMAGELADWPKGRELAYDALDAANHASQLFGNDYGARMGIDVRKALLAKEDGRLDVARKALSDWIAASAEWQKRGAQIDFQTGIQVMKIMATVGMSEEGQQLAASLRGDRNFSRNNHYQRMLRRAENELAILQGKSSEVTGVLAWAPAEDARGRIAWDLRPAGGGEDDNATTWMTDLPLSKVSGVYTLELYFGETESAMKRVFSKPAAPARGVWTGTLPSNQGFVRAVLRKGEEMRIGPAIAVTSGKMLQAPEGLLELLKARFGAAKGWIAVPPVVATLEEGGPLGAKFVRIDGDPQNQMELVAERIPIDPRKNYLVGGWFHYSQNTGNARIGWRVCDANGKDLGNYFGSGNFQGDQWNYAVMRFGRGRNFSGLSESAAWLEPYAEFKGRCDLQGMFVTEVPSAADEE